MALRVGPTGNRPNVITRRPPRYNLVTPTLYLCHSLVWRVMNSDRMYVNVVGQRVTGRKPFLNSKSVFVCQSGSPREILFSSRCVFVYKSGAVFASRENATLFVRREFGTKLDSFRQKPNVANPCACVKRAHAKRRIEMHRRPCTMTRAYEKITFKVGTPHESVIT